MHIIQHKQLYCLAQLEPSYSRWAFKCADSSAAWLQYGKDCSVLGNMHPSSSLWPLTRNWWLSAPGNGKECLLLKWTADTWASRLPLPLMIVSSLLQWDNRQLENNYSSFVRLADRESSYQVPISFVHFSGNAVDFLCFNMLSQQALGSPTN